MYLNLNLSVALRNNANKSKYDTVTNPERERRMKTE